MKPHFGNAVICRMGKTGGPLASGQPEMVDRVLSFVPAFCLAIFHFIPLPSGMVFSSPWREFALPADRRGISLSFHRVDTGDAVSGGDGHVKSVAECRLWCGKQTVFDFL